MVHNYKVYLAFRSGVMHFAEIVNVRPLLKCLTRSRHFPMTSNHQAPQRWVKGEQRKVKGEQREVKREPTEN